MMSIVTCTGDDGTSGLLTGERLSKGSDRFEAIGSIDELNAVLGVCIAEIDSNSAYDRVPAFALGALSGKRVRDKIMDIQIILFVVGADLAAPLNSKAHIRRISGEEIGKIEKWINDLEKELPELKNFILPGGSKISAHLHLARTVCRRAERCVVRLSEKEKINENVHVFLNRLGDYVFLAARMAG